MAAELASIRDTEIASKPAASNTPLRSDLLFMVTASLGPKSPSTCQFVEHWRFRNVLGKGVGVYPRVFVRSGDVAYFVGFRGVRIGRVCRCLCMCGLANCGFAFDSVSTGGPIPKQDGAREIIFHFL